MLAAVLIGALAARAATGITFGSEKSPLDPGLHDRAVAVMNHYYNFEFEEALAGAEAIQDSSPQDPIGHFLTGEIYFWRTINNPDDPQLVGAFRAAVSRAIDLGKALLDEDDRDPMALFVLGGAYGRRAILYGIDGRHLEAVHAALTGRKFTKLLRKHHPEFDDAYFGLGLYNYYAAQLPWFARVLSKLLLGLGGNQERGMAQLERAAERGLFTQVEARLILSIIYLDSEGRYPEALAILQELNDSYPDNLDYYGMLGFAYRTQHDYSNAIRMLETMADKAASSPHFGRRSRGMAHYFLGSTYKVAGRLDAALGSIDEVVELAADGDNNWLLVSALLERGRVHDLQGNRDAALRDYHRVLDVKDFRGSHDKARRYIETPYTAPPEETAHYLAGAGPGAASDAVASHDAGGAATGGDDAGPVTVAAPGVSTENVDGEGDAAAAAATTPR